MSHINNGLMTKIWGPHMWFAINCVSFGYPVNPTQEQKRQYKTFFEFLGFVLPCEFCKISYQFFITDGDTLLSDDVFENRETLTKWIFKLHNRVNLKLGVNYGTTYEEFINKYELFRARCLVDISGCQMPLELKSIAFKEEDKKDNYIISKKVALCFKEYAEKRGILFDKLDYYEDLVKNKRNTQEYENRNKLCQEIIQNMRFNAKSSLELEGEFINKPTIDELKLISMLSTSIPIKELYDCTTKLGYNVITKYKLVKS